MPGITRAAEQWDGSAARKSPRNAGAVMPFTHDQVYDWVCRIPEGRVATYGQIARLAGYPRHARQVGYALAALRGRAREVPWQRVVNANGGLSPRSGGNDGAEYQRLLLESEGLRFDDTGRLSLARYQWRP